MRAKFVVLGYTSLLTGVVTRLVMLRSAFSRGRDLPPIGKLIVVDELIKMVGYSTIFVFTFLASESEEEIGRYVGQTGCSWVHFFSTTGVMQTYIGTFLSYFTIKYF